jgi:hypothetical protein
VKPVGTEALPLFHPPADRAVDGVTYEPAEDHVRLSGQLARVRQVMRDGEWHTLDYLVNHCGGTAASVSARLRDLRKPKYGSATITRQRVAGGLFAYRMEPL